ncbi:hypothetical protein Hanom_Chr00s002077g01691571 [Helianthus anomalus]
MSRAMLTTVPYPIAVVKPAATEKQRQVKLSTKSHKKASGSSNTVGFGAKKKKALWQCVTNCGACCKLDKGPSFSSPEEIFDDSSDIQVHPFLFLINFLILVSYCLCVKNWWPYYTHYYGLWLKKREHSGFGEMFKFFESEIDMGFAMS